MLIQRHNATLLVIDVQDKLLPAIHDAPGLLSRINWLVSVANASDLPIIISEQYPKGLGRTVSDLITQLPSAPIVSKQHFSCVAAQCLPEALLQQQQIILCGIETHVCVLQTAIHLLNMGKNVFIVADAVGSRRLFDHKIALKRMQQAGAILVSREMVLFELLEQSGTEHFKQMSKRYLQGEQPI